MADLFSKIQAEKENVEITLQNLEIAMARKNKTVVELAAIATFLHNIYNGIENILKQILISKEVEISRTGAWHKDLLNNSLSLNIISNDLSDNLYEYLTFRHFFVHGYGFMLHEGHLKGLADRIPDVWSEFLTEIEA